MRKLYALVFSKKRFKAAIQILPIPGCGLMFICLRGYFDRRDAGTQKLLENADDYCRDHGYPTVSELVDQSAKDHLMEYVQQNEVDLIAMGNSIRNLLLRHLLGDTVLNTIQLSDRPLFLAN
jgi:nucleotide-binding universal stress UspA family protein